MTKLLPFFFSLTVLATACRKESDYSCKCTDTNGNVTKTVVSGVSREEAESKCNTSPPANPVCSIE